VAISPDVVSFIHRHSGCCDLLWRSGIRNVARKASPVSLATGMARNVTCCAASRKAEALALVPPSPAGASHFAPPQLAASSVLSGFKLESSLPKRRRLS
jgi:hypothetical protein